MKNFVTFGLLIILFEPLQAIGQTIELFDEITDNNTTIETIEKNNSKDDNASPVQQHSETNYLDSYIDDIETEKKAQTSARDLLNQRPTILNLRQNEIKSLNKLKEKTQTITKTTDNEKNNIEAFEARKKKITENLQKAPLGLYWGATLNEIKELGFDLLPAERKDYQNVYQVTNPQQNNNTFQKIIAIFGVQDKLWCIFAQGYLLDDDTKGSKVLALYHRYYEALSQKYGNAEEHFSPYTYEKELVEGETKKIKTIKNPLGGNNFLKELQEGKAFLYATFQNDEIGVTLGVSVDGNGKSYISLDYKDFALRKNEQQEILTRTVEDL